MFSKLLVGALLLVTIEQFAAQMVGSHGPEDFINAESRTEPPEPQIIDTSSIKSYPDFTKLIVATGRKGDLTSVEVISLDEPPKTCENLPELPTGLKGPTGQFYNRSNPTICGGVNGDINSGAKDFCECYTFVNGGSPTEAGEWITHSSPRECGTYARSVLLSTGEGADDDGKDDLWLITGGLSGITPVARTEAFNGVSWLETGVQKLPVAVYLHCLVRLNNKVLMLIGGTTPTEHASAQSFIYDNERNSWSKGPSLKQGRSGHACGVLRHKDEKTDKVEQYVIVAGGSTGSTYADQVEILRADNQSNEWEEGPALPRNVLFGTMVEFQGSVILVGGGGDDIRNSTLDKVSFDGDSLYQLKTIEGPWIELPQKLKEKRSQIATFLVSDDFVRCE